MTVATVPRQAAIAAPPDPSALRPVVVVRPADGADLDGVRAFLAGLSLDSSYRRFFTGVGRVPVGFVRRLVDVDHDRREAIVAVAGGRVVALADYAVCGDHPGTAEFGVVVADDWQRRGLGPRLVEDVIALARARGMCRLRAHTLAENARVARLLRRRWPGARPVREDTLLIWDLPL